MENQITPDWLISQGFKENRSGLLKKGPIGLDVHSLRNYPAAGQSWYIGNDVQIPTPKTQEDVATLIRLVCD